MNCIFDNITLDSSISGVIDVSASNTEIKYCTVKNSDLYNSVYVDGYYNISGTLNLEKNNFDGFIRIQDGGILSPTYLILTSEIGLPSNIIGLKAIIQDDNENSIVINKKLTFLISDGSEIIASGNKGIWTATHTFNQTGSYHISATISNSANLTVNEIDVNIGIPSKFAYVNLSGDLKIIALLLSEQGNPIAYGNITYIIDNVVYNTATDSSGLVNIQNISGKTITLKYEGDNVYNPTNISLILSNITPAKTSSKFNIASGKVIKIYAVDYSAGERGKDVKFRLTDVNGNPIAGAIVNIAFKTSNYKKVSDANGYVKLAISSSASGKYLSVISFLGDAEYDPVVVPFTFNIVKKTVTINAKAKTFSVKTKTKVFSVTLKTKVFNSRNKKVYLKKGNKVTVTITGTPYTAQTNAKGKATFKIKNLIKKGKYTAKIRFAGDSTYKSTRKNVQIRVR